ncbi:hypothetical protein LMG27952_04890 [Paraburkholderia hiiakae]|uniref:Uncharacterized protein n=1 Tax=Paraburkholderia hiiakae TaxID=1081782 RepID=A0ABN7I815_9BURK|nr:hypothetical protein LMG27952_04890 [Paraburkholderia hiiakae]
MKANKHSRGVLVLLPALLCWSTLAKAEMPELNTSASGNVKAPTDASVKVPPHAANAQTADGASSAASHPDNRSAPSGTRSLVPESPHPSVDPTQPWPRHGAVDESK